MAKKFYAIKKGCDSETGEIIENKIVGTWSECLKCVKGVKGAQYKSFTSMSEAESYLSEGNGFLRKENGEYPMDIMHAYADGSFNNATEKFSYGLLLVENNIVQYVESGAAQDNSMKSIRQIAGELKGAVRAAEYAVSNNIKKIVLFHDYVGVCYHATGAWERKDESSKKYYEKMNTIMKEKGLEIIFVKVDSHTGDLFNEIVDELAKVEAKIPLTNVSDKIIREKGLTVKNEEVKEKLSCILRKETLDNSLDIISTHKEDIEKNKVFSFKDEREAFKIIREEMKKNEDEAKNIIWNLDEDIKNNLLYTIMKKISK